MRLLFIVAVYFSIPAHLVAQDTDASDILFLKIQQLEGEIESIRSELESQSYLLEKLLSDSTAQNNTTSNALGGDSSFNEDAFRFKGINDSQSIEDIYTQAIELLNAEKYPEAKKSFLYLVENFDDGEKIPLSLFWLGEISLLESSLLEGETYFQLLAANHPDHWRTPLAHKKIGDIFMMAGETDSAKAKYQFVIQKYPSNSASSLALQLLENME